MGIHEVKLGQGEHETENHNTRQDTGLTVLPPPGRGVGTLEAPQDRHGETSRMDQGTPELWRGRELRRPWLAVFMAVPSSFAPASMAGSYYTITGQKLGLSTGTGARSGLDSESEALLWAGHETNSPPWSEHGERGSLRGDLRNRFHRGNTRSKQLGNGLHGRGRRKSLLLRNTNRQNRQD